MNVFQHEQTMNSSFDDLPPPPPPISSSPAPPDDDVEEVRFRQKLEKSVKNSSDSENFLNFQVSESDNCSSVATAQIPVPQQRSSIRRNEYVNIPIPQRVSIIISSISM